MSKFIKAQRHKNITVYSQKIKLHQALNSFPKIKIEKLQGDNNETKNY